VKKKKERNKKIEEIFAEISGIAINT